MDKQIRRANSLLRKAQKGDEKALDALLVEFGPLLKSFAVKYLYDRSYADDLVSEVLLELLQTKLKSFDPNFNGLNWLYTIIKRRAYKYNGRFLARSDMERSYDELNLRNVLYTFDAELGRSLDRAAIADALGKLSEYENKLLYYAYWECKTVREIAELVGSPRSTVSKTINDSLAKLRKILK